MTDPKTEALREIIADSVTEAQATTGPWQEGWDACCAHHAKIAKRGLDGAMADHRTRRIEMFAAAALPALMPSDMAGQWHVQTAVDYGVAMAEELERRGL